MSMAANQELVFNCEGDLTPMDPDQRLNVTIEIPFDSSCTRPPEDLSGFHIIEVDHIILITDSNLFADGPEIGQYNDCTNQSEPQSHVQNSHMSWFPINLNFTDEQPGKVKCKSCNKIIKKSSLRKHLRTHLPEIEKEKFKKECRFCGERVLTWHMAPHVSYHHNRYQWNCDTCTLKFKTVDNLAKHINDIHHNCGNHISNKCKKDLNTKEVLTVSEHSQRHDARLESHNAGVCTENSTSYAEQNSHNVDHLLSPSVPQWECKVCGKEFLEKRNLWKHKERQVDLKRHKCSTCGKQYRVKRYLKRHKCINTSKDLTTDEQKVKYYKCPIPTCESVFAQKSSVRRHLLRTHNTLKDSLSTTPFNCSIPTCEGSFDRKSSLSNHLKAHNNNIPKSSTVVASEDTDTPVLGSPTPTLSSNLYQELFSAAASALNDLEHLNRIDANDNPTMQHVFFPVNFLTNEGFADETESLAHPFQDLLHIPL